MTRVLFQCFRCSFLQKFSVHHPAKQPALCGSRETGADPLVWEDQWHAPACGDIRSVDVVVEYRVRVVFAQVDFIDVTLACEDANSKLVDVVTVADVDSEDHVGNSLLQIRELTFGPETKLFQILSTRVGQDFEVEVQQDFETGACSAFCR